MTKREQVTISLSREELKRAKAVASKFGETFSGFVRRQIMMIVKEEEDQQ